MRQFLCARKYENENESDAASAACFQNIKYQVEYNVMYVDSIGDSLLTFL